MQDYSFFITASYSAAALLLFLTLALTLIHYVSAKKKLATFTQKSDESA